jgi:poly-gamma-glutamate synthesis protein (capsule biosynthesis protein)
MTFIGAGDCFITRRLPSPSDRSFQDLKKIIMQGEFRFSNLEVTTHNFEGFPSAVSGGTWAIADPDVLHDVRNYGFNTLAWANNHTLDYSYGGLAATRTNIDKYGFVHAGVGKNLADASAPGYVDCPSGRVALIATTSTFNETWAAGEQRPDADGRPGVNPLSFKSEYIVSSEQLEQLKAIADHTGINADHNLAIKEGFIPPSNENSFTFGRHEFKAGFTQGLKTTPHKRDMDRIIKAIAEAKRQADYVVVSIHTHEMKGEDKSKPADFVTEFSRKCIDHGAHAIIGHGPHILRGIEIYNQRPIFYSLGNFVFQNETVVKLPHDFYEKYKMDFESTVADAFDKRSDNGKKGLGVNPDVWESIIPFWSMKNGKLEEIILYPIELGFGFPRYRKGWPKLSENPNVLKKLKALSSQYGTNIEIINNLGYIRPSRADTN